MEERVIKEGTLRRKLEAKSQVWDAQVPRNERSQVLSQDAGTEDMRSLAIHGLAVNGALHRWI